MTSSLRYNDTMSRASSLHMQDGVCCRLYSTTVNYQLSTVNYHGETLLTNAAELLYVINKSDRSVILSPVTSVTL